MSSWTEDRHPSCTFTSPRRAPLAPAPVSCVCSQGPFPTAAAFLKEWKAGKLKICSTKWGAKDYDFTVRRWGKGERDVLAGRRAVLARGQLCLHRTLCKGSTTAVLGGAHT